MSKKIVAQLRSKQTELLAESEALLQLSEERNEPLTKEEEEHYQSLQKQIEEINSKCNRYEALEAQKQKLLGNVQLPIEMQDPKKLEDSFQESYAHGGKLTCFINQKTGEEDVKKAYRFGCFLAAAIYKMPKYIEKCQEWGYNVKKLAMGSSSTLVPPEFSNEIIKLRNQYGTFRRNARFRNMGSNTLNFPRHTGNVVAYWIDENTAKTESDNTYANVQLVAKKLAALTRYSDELDEDSMIDIGDELATDFAWAMAYAEDLAGFLGDGTGTYGSVSGLATILNDTNHDASLYTAAAGETSIGTLDIEDFIEVIARLPQQYHQFAKWYCSAYSWAAGMLRLGGVAGGNNLVTISQGMSFNFLGYPVELTPALPTAGMAAGAIPYLFGALRFSSSLGERKGLTIEKSEHRYFEYDQVGIRAVERIDIENHDLGTDTVAGPVIALKLAAA